MAAAPGSCSGQLSAPSGDPQGGHRSHITQLWEAHSPLQLLRTVCLQGILQGESLASDAKKGKGPVHTGVPEGQLI